MIAYSVIVFAAAVALLVLGRCIAKGNTSLINCYHPERVEDKDTYCRKIGQAMYIMGTVMALSGGIGLVGEACALAAVVVLIVGEIGGMVLMIHAQKKYGGGVF